MKYRIESNLTRQPASAWFDFPSEQACAALNIEAYHAGRGGEFGIYAGNGDRVHP